MYRICLNFAKSCISSRLSKFCNKKKKFTMAFLKYKRLNLNFRVFLAGHSVAMATYSVTKLIQPSSPVIGSFLTPLLQHQLIKSGYNDTSKSKSWKALETILSHLKAALHIGWQLRKKLFSYWVEQRGDGTKDSNTKIYFLPTPPICCGNAVSKLYLVLYRFPVQTCKY